MASWNTTGSPRLGNSLIQRNIDRVRPSNGTNIANYITSTVQYKENMRIANAEAQKEEEQLKLKKQKCVDCINLVKSATTQSAIKIALKNLQSALAKYKKLYPMPFERQWIESVAQEFKIVI